MTIDQLRAALKDLPGDLKVYLPLRRSGSTEADELLTLFLGRVREEEYGNLSRCDFIYETTHKRRPFSAYKEQALFLSNSYFSKDLKDSVVFTDEETDDATNPE